MAKTNKNTEGQKKAEEPNGEKGRPTLYTEELADRICDLIATNTCSLQRMCKEHDWMPAFRTIFKWLHEKDKEHFMHKYAHAKKMQADLMVEELTDISDNGQTDYYVDEKGNFKVDHENIQRSKLRVDTRKWIASKILPKKFGERLDLTTGGEKLNSEQQFDLTKLSDGALAELEAARIISNKGGAL